MSALREVNLRLIVVLVFITSVQSVSGNTLSDECIKRQMANQRARSTRNIQSDPSMNYRLPNNSLPISYDLWMATDIHEGDLKFSGRVKIRISIIEESNAITMHSRDIIVVNVDLYDKTGTLSKSNLHFEHYDEVDFLTVSLPSLYGANSEIILDITYHGTMTSEVSGLYATSYQNESHKPVWIATTHFLPTNARKAFVCYDEPQIRAPIQLQIQHDKSYHVLSNMPVSKNETLNETNYVLTIFEETPPIQTYLLSIVVSNLDYISNENALIEQRIYGEPLKIKNGTASFAIKIVEELFNKFREIIPIDLGVSKIDHVVIPRFNGALEHLGLINYEETCLLIDDHFTEEVLQFFKPQIIEIVSHSLAHQYFGGIVSPKWWQYLWLNEGFATFYQYLIPSLLYPYYEFSEIFQNDVIDYAFDIHMGPDTMNSYVETPLDIEKKFNSIVFEKSAAVIKMFYEALSPSTFTKGLVTFLNEMKFKAANSDDLHRALQRAFDEDKPDEDMNISKAMSTWEEQSGYPVISVQKAGKNVILSQKRFLSDENINNIYSIPITFATKSNPNFDTAIVKTWMTSQTLDINEILSTSDEWIIFNVQQVGFYRVDYSRELWDSIINEYKRDFEIIHHTNRKVLHDEMFIAWKILKTKTASDCLELLKVLEYETSAAVWQKAGQYIDPINDFLLYSDVYPRFQDMMHKILLPHLNMSMSLDKKLYHQVTFWSRITQHPIFLKHQLDQLLVYMETENFDDKPDFCSAFRIANSSIYEHFIRRIIESIDIVDMEIGANLGCSLNRTQLDELLSQIMNPLNKVGSYVISTILHSTVDSSVIGLEVIMDLISVKWWEINQLNPDFVVDLFLYIHTFINSLTHLEKFKNLANILIWNGVITLEFTEPLLKNITEKLENEEWKNIKVWFGMDNEEISTVTPSTTENTTLDAVSVSTSIRIIAICISLCFLLKRNFT